MNRSETAPLSETERASMDAIMSAVIGVVAGHPKSLALSVLVQTIVGNLGDEAELDDEGFAARVVAMLGLMNIMQAGVVVSELDQTVLAEAVHDLSSIVTCGPRVVMIPALASVLVSAVACGRRDTVAESECVEAISAALKSLDAALISQG